MMASVQSPSSSLPSESLHSDLTSESITHALSESDETPSLVQELQGATLILPVQEWIDEVPIPIFIQEEPTSDNRSLRPIAEIEKENLVPQSVVAQKVGSLSNCGGFDQLNFTRKWQGQNYITTTMPSREQAAVFDVSNQYPRFMPTNLDGQNKVGYASYGGVTTFADNVDNYFQTSPALTKAKKRGRQECMPTKSSSTKGKGKLEAQSIYTTSSDDNSSDVEENSGVHANVSFSNLDTLTDSEVDLKSITDTKYSAQVINRSENQTVRKIVLKKPTPSRQVKVEYQLPHQYHWQTNANLVQRRDDSKRKTQWPAWLHPAFHRESDHISPRVSLPDLEL